MAEMTKKTFGIAAVVATVLSVGTYVGLNTLFPYQPEEAQVADVADLDEVMGGSLSTTAPEGTAASEASSSPAPAAPDSSAEASAASESGDSATEATAEAALNSETAASEASAAEAEPAPAPEPVEVAAAEPEPAPAPEPEPAPAPKPKKAASKPAPKAAKPSGPTKQYAPAADLKQWWGTPADGSLGLAYAGSLANKLAVVLMFNGAFDSADSINQHVTVKSASGAVAGSWEISANNKRMALFSVPAKGRYTVSVGKGVTDRAGKSLGSTLQGPVYVQ